MKVNEQVHMIRKEFYVTPQVRRYVNIYLIVGEHCYIVDSGVAGSERLIEEYLKSINRKITDIKGVFLTHAHPDHAGAAAAIKRKTMCKIYAPLQEISWIEDIQQQFKERPIPNFFNLLSESVKVDCPLTDGEVIMPEEGIRICTLSTGGHSHGSMSYLLNNETIFTGDAIPLANDLPIFVDYEETIKSLDKIQSLSQIQYYCPAWGEVQQKEEFDVYLADSREMLFRLKNAVLQVEREFPQIENTEKAAEILKRADLLQFSGNPLIMKSIEACKEM